MTLPLALYRALMLLALPILAAATLLPRRGGAGGWAERFGLAPAAARDVLWLHAASNGEAASARTLLQHCLDARPGLEALVTVHTVTGRDLVASWGLPRVHARLAPWDAAPCARALVRRWRPAAHVVVESEIWPERLLACEAAGVPAAMVSARLSARSAARWARAPGTARRLLSTLEGAAPQDAATGERLLALGLARAALWPAETLKAALAPPERPADWEALRAAFARARTVMGASTHEGEEALVVDAWERARRHVPDLALILAPRHPRRLPEVLEAVGERTLSLRSRREAPRGIYVVDTLGELRALYGLAGLAFVGGSVAPRGGHTPYEPVAEGCVVVHGPDVSNASEAYGALAEAGAAIRIEDAGDLAEAFGLVERPDRLAEMAARARAALAPSSGGTAERVAAMLAPR